MYDALVLMEAPPALIAWVSSSSRPSDLTEDLLESNQDPTWTVWMHAAKGVPLRALVEAVAREAKGCVDSLTESKEVLLSVLREAHQMLLHRGDVSKILEAAERAEQLSEHPLGTYRSLDSQPLVRSLAMAVAYIARASEAVYAAEMSLSTQRLAQAQHGAAILGAGTSAMVTGGARALCIYPETLARDPVQQSALFVPAAIAESVRHLVEAYAQREAVSQADAEAAALTQRLNTLLSPLVLA